MSALRLSQSLLRAYKGAPASQGRIEGDEDVHLARIYKGELDVGVLAPLRNVLPDLALQAIKEHDRQYSTS